MWFLIFSESFQQNSYWLVMQFDDKPDKSYYLCRQVRKSFSPEFRKTVLFNTPIAVCGVPVV